MAKRFELKIEGGTVVPPTVSGVSRAGIDPPVKGDAAGLGPFADLVETHVESEVRIDATRGAAGTEAVLEVDDDTVVEVELEGGGVWWTTVGELAEETGQTNEGTVVLRPALGLHDESSRGLGRFIFRRLRQYAVGLVTDAATDLAAREIAHRLESRLNPGPGLYRWPNVDALDSPIERASDLAAGPHLLFLHGTASSTVGSFGTLGDRFQQLARSYQGRILGFEHRSVSTSPVENALDLVRRLPKGAELHLVSHSRGGLVGELLCRGMTDGGPAFTHGELDLFNGRDDERERLVELTRRLAELELRIDRFVRVAAPIRGTLLASRRLDRYLSLTLSALGLVVPTPAAPAYQFLKAMLIALAKKRADPRQLPGLEAMIPDAPLVRLLNTAAGTSAADLTVMAGDIEGRGFLSGLKVLATDLFYRRDHDLVVDSRSMFGGLDRRAGTVRYLFEAGADTDHFSYFENPSTAKALTDALKDRDGGSVPGFLVLEGSRITPVGVRGIQGDSLFEPDRNDELPVDRLRTDRPVVVLLPGIMGTRLRARDNIVWLDVSDLVGEGFARLELDDGDEVTLAGLIESSYRDLAHHLATSHEVVMFGYDWRDDIDAAADRLKSVVKKLVQHTDQPVRFLAHSMGGLVVRRFRARSQPLWTDLLKRPGFRFVMLGTPNDGSHAITSVLLGRESTVKLLTWVAPADEVRRIIAAFPGLLSMLPARAGSRATGDDADLYDHKLWKRWLGKNAGPTEAILERVRAFRQALDEERALDEPGILYVAGQDPGGTPFAVSEEASGRPHLLLTPRGDGRVTWESGIPEEILTSNRVRYAPGVGHGALASERRLFPALTDLLERGESSSTALSGERPSTRGAVPEGVVAPTPLVPFPTTSDLEAAAVGGELQFPVTVTASTPLTVTITNGSLTYARGPVAVGHYERDVITSAERALDRTLDDALTRRHALGLYPGPVGTSEVVIDSLDPTRGALVVGLGPVGELVPATVSRGLRHAVLRYALLIAELDDWERRDEEGRPLLRITSLLIGSGAGTGMSIEDSVLAIIHGVTDAVALLEEQELQPRPRIEELEIVELYESRAICASEALRDLDRLSRLGNGRVEVEVRPTLRSGEGLQRNIICGDSDWYRRIQIVREQRSEGEGGQSDREQCATDFDDLVFTVLTDRARAEVRLLATQRRLVHHFVRRAVGDTSWRPEMARTLFDLLIPQELKAYAPSELDLLLVLDRAAAGYPWELISDGLEDREPLSIRAGMLRQLATAEFRERPVTSAEDRALVIGNPETDDPKFPPLAGAEQEARQVAQQLEATGFTVRGPSRLKKPEDIVVALFAAPYKLIHIAAHGAYEADCPEAAGVVLADGMRITAAEIGQLRQVPELVFINCCHLGDFGGTAEEASDTRARPTIEYHQLAATLGVELIQIGVRAVVVAGWAVDDRAAVTFADAFYRSLVEGVQFGTAVRRARQETYREHHGSNTWGAYQCYGDPAYRLRPNVSSDAPDEPVSWTTPVRLIHALENLRSRARTGSPAQGLRAELEEIEKTLAENYPTWLQKGRVREAMGRAWVEVAGLTSPKVLAELDTEGVQPLWQIAADRAFGHLEDALVCQDGEIAFELLGDLADLRLRDKTARWRATRVAKPSGLEERTATALAEILADLESQAEAHPTTRRWTRVGSAAKRLAAVRNNQEVSWFDGTKDDTLSDRECRIRELAVWKRSDLVNHALLAYRRANQLSLGHCGEDNDYPAANWALLEAVAQLADGRHSFQEPVEPVLARLDLRDIGTNYWDRLIPVQTTLARALLILYDLYHQGDNRAEILLPSSPSDPEEPWDRRIPSGDRLPMEEIRRAVDDLTRVLVATTRQANRNVRSLYQRTAYLESLDTLIDLTDDRWEPSRAGADRLAAARHLIQSLRTEIARQAEAIRDR